MTKQEFQEAYQKAVLERETPTKIVTAVKLPSGATELIINTEEISSKIDYIMNAYDDEMCLRKNREVQIIGCLIV